MAPKKKQEAAQEHGEEDEKEKEHPLSEELMELSDLGRTADGTGVTYRALTCSGKRVNAIKAIDPYIHLRTVDFSQNVIRDPGPLKVCTSLLSVNLSKNNISSINKPWEQLEDGPEIFPYLVHLDLSDNMLKALPKLPFKNLATANFARNEITNCSDFGGHEKLEMLDISENKIKNLEGVANMPELIELDFSGNELVKIDGLSEVPKLQKLRAAKNKFANLDGAWQDLAQLTSLNVADCSLPSLAALAQPLRRLPLLRSLSVQGNPLQDVPEDQRRTELLIIHWRLTTLDDVLVEEAELEKARLLNVKRMEDERTAKRAAEEAAAAEGAGD